MTTISHSGYRFPAEIIQHAVWIYLRFTLSHRDVEELLAERGINVSHETVRRWVTAFGPRYAQRLRVVLCKPNSDWHLDEMFVSIGGKKMYLWRAGRCEMDSAEWLSAKIRHRGQSEPALLEHISWTSEHGRK
jgi:putative transposase